MRFEEQRQQLNEWATKKEQQQTLTDYQKEKNMRSMDDLPTTLFKTQGTLKR